MARLHFKFDQSPEDKRRSRAQDDRILREEEEQLKKDQAKIRAKNDGALYRDTPPELREWGNSLGVSHPSDPQEKQADQIARQVVNNETVSPITPVSTSEVQAKHEGDVPEVTPQFESTLNSSKGSGASMPEELRGEMEGKMNTDFSDVKLHTDARADEMTQEMHAKAFTHGQDIYFRSGKDDFSNKDNKELLAHELVHAGQESSTAIQRAEIKETDKSYVQTWEDYLELSLTQLLDRTQWQLDWYNSPVFSAENDPDGKKKNTIRQFLTFMNKHPNVSVSITVRELIAEANGVAVTDLDSQAVLTGNPAAAFAQLEAGFKLKETHGVNYTVSSFSTAKTAEARYLKLATVMKARGHEKWLWPGTIDAYATEADVDDLKAYIATPEKPIFENADDYPAFGRLNSSGNKVSYYQTELKKWIRNVHRFEAAALDQLIVNYKTTGVPEDQRARLVVVVQGTHDAHPENTGGPLVRDANMTKLILTNNDPLDTNMANKIMVLLLEGKELVTDYKGVFTQLAQDYGRWSRIDQFMVHGHGQDTGINIGKQTVRGTDPYTGEPKLFAEGSLSFKDNSKPTNDFFTEVLSSMEINTRVPKEELEWKSRIVFAACLTNSNNVPESLEVDKKSTPQQTIKNWMKANPNFVSRVMNMAGGGKPFEDNKQNLESVIGSNAVTTPSVGLLDANNRIGQYGGTGSPAITGSKLDYIRYGVEQESVFTALLTEWASINLADYLNAPLYKDTVVPRAKDDVDWVGDNAIIHGAFNTLINPPSNFTSYYLIQRLRMFGESMDARSNRWLVADLDNIRMYSGLTPDEIEQFYKSFQGTTVWKGFGDYSYGSCFTQVLARNKPATGIPELISFVAKPEVSLTMLTGIPSYQIGTITPDVLRFTGLYKEGEWLKDNTDRGQVIIAVAGLKSSKGSVRKTCRKFLAPHVTTDLSPVLAGILGDVSVRNFVREYFKLPESTMESAPALTEKESANLPTQSNAETVGGKNTMRAKPLYITVEGQGLPVYPAAQEKDSIGTLEPGMKAYTSGEMGDWYVIEWPPIGATGKTGTAFVLKKSVTAR